MSRPGFPKSDVSRIVVGNFYTPWNGPTSFGSTNQLKRSVYEDKSGDNTPGFPSVLRTNAYSHSLFSWHANPLSVEGTVDHGNGHIDHFGGEWGDGYTSSPWLGGSETPWGDERFSMEGDANALKSRLIGKLIDNIQNYRVQLGEILHTRHATANMIVSTANRLVSSINALRKGNVAGSIVALTGSNPSKRDASKIARTLGGIPEQWLALQYGWKPLLQDVYNSCETVREAWNQNNTLFTARASSFAQPSKVTIKFTHTSDNGPDWRYETQSREVHGNALIVYTVDSNFESSLSQLGITNPLSLAWELLPYSFVVDWFLPVGSFFDRLDYQRGLSFKHGSISIRRKQTLRRFLDRTSVTVGSQTANWSGGSAEGSAFLFTRDVLGDFPSPPVPSFKDPFSPTHVANALSLLATAFGR